MSSIISPKQLNIAAFHSTTSIITTSYSSARSFCGVQSHFQQLNANHVLSSYTLKCDTVWNCLQQHAGVWSLSQKAALDTPQAILLEKDTYTVYAPVTGLMLCTCK